MLYFISSKQQAVLYILMSLQWGCVLPSTTPHPCCCPDSSCDVIVIACGSRLGCYSDDMTAMSPIFSQQTIYVPLREEFAERATVVWEEILETVVEHFKKCASTTISMARRLALPVKAHWWFNSEHWPCKLVRRWMCRSFKNTLTSLFHVYLPVLMCMWVIYDNSVCISESK